MQAAVATLEVAQWTKVLRDDWSDTQDTMLFSVQQSVDCATSCYGCNGCWTEWIFDYHMTAYAMLEADYPYVDASWAGDIHECSYDTSVATEISIESYLEQ
jgi:hypothetical protein